MASGRPRFGDFDADHEGHWGWTTGDVLERIEGWAESARADIVLLHLGTNDLGREPRGIAANLASIVDVLRRANPRVTVLVARLIPARGVPAGVLDATNDAIAAMAREKHRESSPVVVVDQARGFDPAVDTYDGLHPNESGERKMAARWEEALEPFL